MVDPHAPGGTKHFDRLGVKRKFEEMQQNEDIGNWALETAKSRLHLFLQQTRQPKDMQIRPTGPDHNRSFVAEMTIYIPKLHKTIHAKEHAGTKKLVSNTLALNLVTQLYRLGAIEAARAPGTKKPANEVEQKEVNIPGQIQGMLQKLLQDLNITPVPPPEDLNEPTSVLLPLPKPEADPEKASDVPGVIEWQPPHIDWSPWTHRSAYLEGGAYATMEPEARANQLSQDLYQDLSRRKATDSALQQNLQERQQLPISSKAEELVAAIQAHPVVIVRGSTGCGKTTQVPQFILDSMIAAGQGAHCNIVVTQPRRISAVSVAERVAQERCEELGFTAGYSVRFESVLPRHYASILFCTVGVLLRKLEAGLVGVSHVIIDEVHERDINTDFALIVLRDMLRVYPALKVVLMSATIDTSLFSNYFNDCPVLEIPEKIFTVQEYFLEDAIEMLHFIPPPQDKKKKKRELDDPAPEEEDDEQNMNLLCDTANYSLSTQHAMAQMSEYEISFELIEALLLYFKSLEAPGAVLIFLPGWNTIFALHRYLTNHPVFGCKDYTLLPCHSQIPREDQRKVFAPVPEGVTKVTHPDKLANTRMCGSLILKLINCVFR